MTALSKATLKNIWKARFQPQASDFANLIDSWTDYSVPLETLAAAVSGGSVGVPLYTSAASVTMVAASAAAVAGIPIYSGSNTAATVAPTGSQMFWASTSSVGGGIRMQVVGGLSANLAQNYVTMTTYQGSASTLTGNLIEAQVYGGSPTSSKSVAANVNVLRIAAASQGELGLQYGAQMLARTIVATSAVGSIEWMFYVGDTASVVTTDRQLRVRKGAVNFEPKVSAIATPVAGDVYYDSGTNKLRCWNGTSWNDLF